jgi:hypothetical protein
MAETTLLLIVAEVALIAGLIHRWRMKKAIGRRERREGLSDDDILKIEHDGRLEMDEGLDLEEIRREEERFWSQYWDEPDEF